MQMVADGIGADIDGVSSEMETWSTDEALDTAAGTISAGTVTGQRWRWTATVDGEPLADQETMWRMHGDAAPDWPRGDWSISIEGDRGMRLSLPHSWNRG
jgi:hypothetical protein